MIYLKLTRDNRNKCFRNQAMDFFHHPISFGVKQNNNWIPNHLRLMKNPTHTLVDETMRLATCFSNPLYTSKIRNFVNSFVTFDWLPLLRHAVIISCAMLVINTVFQSSSHASMRFGSRSIRDTVKESNTVSTISQQSGCPDAANTGEVHYTDTAESFDCDGDADFTFTESTNSVDMNGQLAVGATATTDQNVNNSFYNGISAIEEELVMLSETFTGTTNRNFGVLSEVILNPTGTSEVNSYGLASDIYVLSTNAQNITGALIGVIGAVENDGTGTLTTGIGVQGIVSRIGSDGDGTITRKIGGHF